MRVSKYYLIILFCAFSCQKKSPSTVEQDPQDTITEITYSSDPDYALQNESTESLLDHLESQQKELKTKLKSVNNRKDADLLFLQYQKKFAILVDSLNSTESEVLNMYGQWTENTKPDSIVVREKRFKQLGMFIRNIDSNYYDIKFLPGFYHKIFKNKASHDLREYLSLIGKNNQLNYDIQMNIKTFDVKDYRELAIEWENYMRKYPKSEYQDKVYTAYEEVMMKYLFGNKKNKTFDEVSKRFNEQIEQEYIGMIKKYPKTKTAHITKEFMKFFYINDSQTRSSLFYKDLRNKAKEEITKALNQ